MATGKRPTLLLTRPQADSERFAAMLPEWPVVISPILRIVPVAHDAARLASAAGLVFTSSHAIPSAGAGDGRLALCVGARTAQVARQAGFQTREGNGFATSLLPLIAAAAVPLIHPHGRHLAQELPVEGMVVYDQQALPLTSEARELLALEAPIVLPLFSPRSARLVSEQVQDARAELWPVAISDAAMAAWDAPAVLRVIADDPTAVAMAAAIRRLPVREH